MKILWAAALVPLFGPDLSAFQEDPTLRPPLIKSIDGAAKSIRGYKTGNVPPRAKDDEFLRRVMRDILGSEPTPEELQAFLKDTRLDKRARKINELLASDHYARFWADRFAKVFFDDAVDVPMSRLFDLAPAARPRIVREFKTWLEEKLRQDRGWNEIVLEMLDARGSTATSPELGYKLSFFRGKGYPIEFAKGASRHFLGIRLYCATCHDQPYDQWRVEDAYGLAAFAVREQAKIIGANKDQVGLSLAKKGEMALPRMPPANNKAAKVRLGEGGVASPKFLFGGMAGAEDDRMRILAKFMTMKANTQLPRTVTNRVWGWLMGRALVHPPDDFNMRNRPLSKSLLEVMTRGLMQNGYSLKYLIHAICNTDIYQLSDPGPPPPGRLWLYRGTIRRERDYYYGKEPKVRVTAPEGWVREGYAYRRLWPYGVSPKLMYRVPDKEKKSLDAVFSGKLGQSSESRRWKGHLRNTMERKLKGGETIKLVELSGEFTCDPRFEGPTEYRVLIGEVTLGLFTSTFHLAGPKDTVDDWREEYIELLKGVRRVPRKR